MSAIDRRAANPRPFLPPQLVRMLGLATCLSLLGVACQSTAPSSPSPSTASQPSATTTASSVAASPSARTGCRIGTSWDNYAEIDVEQSFGQGITQALQDPGVHYVEMDAKSSTTEQNAQINQAVDDGIDALIVRAQNPDLVLPAVERALSLGVRVVALDRPIMNPNVLFVGQDDARTGELEAQALLAAKPSGRFVVINGSASSTVSLLRRQGMTRAGLPDVGKSSDTLVNVGEAFTPRWDPLIAQTEMEEFLKRNGNKVDMALVEDDYMAGGVFAALKDRGLAGKVLVVGAGGDELALNRVALGLQIADVATDRSQVGRIAGEAALALCSDPRVDEVATSAGKPAPFTAPGSITIPAVLVEPIAFDRSNLRIALDRHFGTAYYVCKDVPPGSVDGC